MWEGCFLILEKGLFGFVPGDLLGRDLGIMSKMFSLRANLWEKS